MKPKAPTAMMARMIVSVISCSFREEAFEEIEDEREDQSRRSSNALARRGVHRRGFRHRGGCWGGDRLLCAGGRGRRRSGNPRFGLGLRCLAEIAAFSQRRLECLGV